jgi:phage baseplate assembly protein W
VISGAAVVSQNLKEIIMAAAGEREMVPGWGGGLAALLFENTEVAAELAKRRLMEAITNYEPRALISDISFTIEDTSIEVSVSFLLNTTGESDEVRAVLSRGN